MSCEKKIKKTLMPYGFEAICYAAISIPLIAATDAKTAVESVGMLYLTCLPLRHILDYEIIEFRKPKSRFEAIIAKTFCSPLDETAKNGFQYFKKITI